MTNHPASPTPVPAETNAWQAIESAPKDGRAMLLGHFNSHGNWRTIRGAWCSADAIAETWENEADEGWYEMAVEADDTPSAWWTEPTHWMPLPAPPGATGPASQCDRSAEAGSTDFCALPPLPPAAMVDVEVVNDVGDYRFFTADQMRAYARAALASQGKAA